MSEQTHIVLGSGIDGVVVAPPLPCSATLSIPLNNYVGKFIYTRKPLETIHKIYELVQSLPDEFNHQLYEKDMMICDVNPELVNRIKLRYPLHTLQMILPRIQGSTLLTTLELSQYRKHRFTNTQWGQLIQMFFTFYTLLQEMNERGYYHNDINMSNIVLDTEHQQLKLIDFDQMSIGKSTATYSTVRKEIMDDLAYTRMVWRDIVLYMTAPEDVSEEVVVLEDEHKNSPDEYKQREAIISRFQLVQYKIKGKYKFIQIPSHEEFNAIISKLPIIQDAFRELDLHQG